MSKHIVERAIILAAGKGERMYPLTYTIPKPLVKVNGERMIDSVISALKSNGISEIYVVIGYLKEWFYQWVKDKEGITLVENPFYEQCNNISSLYVVREHLSNCMIIDGDQIIHNSKILDSHFTRSGYNAVWSDTETKEWLMEVENGTVKACSRSGGSHGWQLYSISRWNSKDGYRLRKQLEYEFERGNKDLYWDDVVMFKHFDEFELGIFEMNSDDVIEIDSLDELIKLDSSYIQYKKYNVPNTGSE